MALTVTGAGASGVTAEQLDRGNPGADTGHAHIGTGGLVKMVGIPRTEGSPWQTPQVLSGVLLIPARCADRL